MPLIPHPFQAVIESVPVYLKLSVCILFMKPRNKSINSLEKKDYPKRNIYLLDSSIIFHICPVDY